MNAIQQSKRTLNSGLIFKFSKIGFALHSTLCYTNQINVGLHDYAEYAAQLRDGDSIFISTRETDVSVHMIISILRARNVKVVFYIIEEPVVSWEFVERLIPVSKRIFIQNNIYDHHNIHIMPIGLRDCGTIVAKNRKFDHRRILEKGVSFRTVLGANVRPIKCLLCFNISSHPSRNDCYNVFIRENGVSMASFIYNINNNAISENCEYREKPNNSEYLYESIPDTFIYQKLLESQYALCPRGSGFDTHLFYECIYLGCVPIVIRTHTVFDRLYAVFPCLVVERWEDVSMNLLTMSYSNCFVRMRDFNAKYPRFFTDLDSINDLLLKL
jgi:hypothetical protein